MLPPTQPVGLNGSNGTSFGRVADPRHLIGGRTGSAQNDRRSYRRNTLRRTSAAHQQGQQPF